MSDCKTIQNKALRLREEFYLKIKELDSTVDGFLSVDDINDPSIVTYQLADAALEIDLIEKYQSESDSCGNGNLESAVNRLEYHLDHLKEENPIYNGGFGCSEPIRPPKFRGASYRTFFESSCPVLNEYPPDIDYQKDTDEFTNPGLQLEAGPAVMSASDDVANCVGKSNGRGLNWFRCLDTVLHEKLTFKDNDNKIARRKADDILTDGDASGCNDFGISATAILRNLGYETLFLSTAKIYFLQGNTEDYLGHAFLEVYDPFCNDFGCWLLYDPTNHYLYTGYDPQNLSLPGGYQVFAKSTDLWSIGVRSDTSLKNCMHIFKTDFYEVAGIIINQPNYTKEDLSKED